MLGRLTHIDRRDAVAAGAVMALGVFGIVEALGYELGEMRSIGPGAFPLIVSVLILLSGLLIAAEGMSGRADDDAPDGPPNYRVLIFVTAGLLAFVFITPLLGALPGMVACVFLSVAADGRLKLWQTALLAVAVVGFCSVVFVEMLNLPLDLVEW